VEVVVDREPELDLKHFDLDPSRGFLPAEDPLVALPSHYALWDQLGAELGSLVLSGRARSTLAAIQELEVEPLADPRALRRAMMLLSYFGHAYVWGESVPAAMLPRAIAVPWAKVAACLGRPPVLSYASYALDNWRRFDSAGGVTLDNIALLQNFLGGADEDWFIAIHIEIEFRASEIVREIPALLVAAQHDDLEAIARGLRACARALEEIVVVLQRMPEHCDPFIYYRQVRPYIHGWRDHPALPDGVVYEGVAEFSGVGQHFRGETGAQSGIVPALDALVGLEHADDPLRGYLREMREYMPPLHHQFIHAVETHSELRSALMRASLPAAAEARELYDECLQWLEAFRSTHLQFAASYIFHQSQSDPANPTALGTGGTPFMPYLGKHRDETAGSRLGRGPC
jgi:indoleamine 2,3-dioxygenase